MRTSGIIMTTMLLLAALPVFAQTPATLPAASQPASAPAVTAVSAPASEPAQVAATQSASTPTGEPARTDRHDRRSRSDRSSRGRDTGTVARSDSAGAGNYRVIYERNIFLKDRTPRPVQRWEPPKHAPTYTPPPPRQIVLTGVTIREKVKLAYFEDSVTGDLVRAIPGDVLQGAKIVDVLLDGVEIDLKGEKKCLAIGMSILGSGPVDMSSASASGSTGSSASSSADSTSSSGGDDILERMKKRRQKELKP